MTYLFPWIFLIVGSLIAGIGLFVWSYQSGQFSDQQRARYLPLRGTAKEHLDRDGTPPYELIVLLAGGGGILLFTLIFACIR